MSSLRERIEGLIARLRSTKGHLAAVVLANDTADALAAALAAEGQGREVAPATDNEIFKLACKLVDTAGSDRQTYWLPVLSQLCEAVRKQDAAFIALAAAPALHKERPGGEWVYAKVEHVTEDGLIVARHWRPLERARSGPDVQLMDETYEQYRERVSGRDAVRREVLEEAAQACEADNTGAFMEANIRRAFADKIRALASPAGHPAPLGAYLA